MAVIRIKGLKQVTKHLASGEVKTYWYAWRGGPLLTGEPGSPEFHASYQAATTKRRECDAETIRWLVDKFKDSSDFTTKSAKTQRDYKAYLKLIEAEFCHMPLKAVEAPRARGRFMEWRDKFAKTPRKADYTWSVLLKLMSFAKNRGYITINPCEKGGRLYEADRAEVIWSEADLVRLFAVCSTEIRAAVMVALWTGARQGDVLRMPWSAYDGRFLRFRQGKTGRRVTVPVSTELAQMIALLPKKGTTILTQSEGLPWTESGFRSSFGKAKDKAGLDMHFHDLRGTAVTRLALLQCTVPEIASFTGHSLSDVEEILDKHYLGERHKLAEAVLLKLETGTKSP